VFAVLTLICFLMCLKARIWKKELEHICETCLTKPTQLSIVIPSSFKESEQGIIVPLISIELSGTTFTCWSVPVTMHWDLSVFNNKSLKSNQLLTANSQKKLAWRVILNLYTKWGHLHRSIWPAPKDLINCSIGEMLNNKKQGPQYRTLWHPRCNSYPLWLFVTHLYKHRLINQI